MREITITYTNVKIEKIIVELARYIEDGFHLNCLTSEMSCGCGEKYTIELVKY